MKLISYLLLSSAGAAVAQQELDPITVQAAREKQSRTAPTAEESRAELVKTPGGVEVVDSARYLTGRASTVADTFALSPGVFAQPRFGSDEARLSIRGSGLQRTFHGRGIRLLQDGVPLNLADGGFDFQAIDPLSASYINVWRGANALAYGASTLGGAIDYVSHTGLTAPGYSLRLEGGSYDYLRARIAAGIAEGPYDLYATFSQQYSEGFRDHAEQNNQRLFANFGWQISDDIESRLYITAINTDSELPGNLTKALMEDDPRQAAAANLTGDQHRDFQLYRIANKTSFRNGNSTLDFTAAWTYKDLDHPIFQVVDQNSNDALLGITFTNTDDLFGREHRLRAGALFQRGETKAANYVNDQGSRGALVQKDEQTATNLEAFVESQLSLGAGFTGILGLAASHNERETERVAGLTPPNSSYDRSYDNLSPKVGLRWDAPSFQIYTNVSGSYEPPSFSESGTAVVANEEQKATTFEIGTRGSHEAFRWDASYYYAKIDDELLTIQIPPGNGATGTINADHTIHQGLEIGGEYDLLGSSWEETPDHRLVFRAAWTYGDFRFDDDDTYGDNEIAGIPPHLIRGELTWENSCGYYAGPTFEWVPTKAYVDHRNTLSADPYALVGFKVGRRVAEGISWFIEARNLTDETYAATTGVIENAGGNDAAQFLPGDGRSVYAGLEWKW